MDVDHFGVRQGVETYVWKGRPVSKEEFDRLMGPHKLSDVLQIRLPAPEVVYGGDEDEVTDAELLDAATNYAGAWAGGWRAGEADALRQYKTVIAVALWCVAVGKWLPLLVGP